MPSSVADVPVCLNFLSAFYRRNPSQNMTFSASKVTFQLSESRNIWHERDRSWWGATNLSSPRVLVDGYNVKR